VQAFEAAGLKVSIEAFRWAQDGNSKTASSKTTALKVPSARVQNSVLWSWGYGGLLPTRFDD
jgi:hypothetical protein